MAEVEVVKRVVDSLRRPQLKTEELKVQNLSVFIVRLASHALLLLKWPERGRRPDRSQSRARFHEGFHQRNRRGGDCVSKRWMVLCMITLRALKRMQARHRYAGQVDVPFAPGNIQM